MSIGEDERYADGNLLVQCVPSLHVRLFRKVATPSRRGDDSEWERTS